MNYRKCIIYSIKHDDFDELYIITPDRSVYYLFRTRHNRSVQNFYGCGVRYDRATDFSAAKRNPRICGVMERIPPAVRYISKECLCA